MDLQRISVVHFQLEPVSGCVVACSADAGTYSIWCVLLSDSLTVKEEPYCPYVLALSLAESIHQLLQLSASLDLEEDLIVIVGDFDVEMLDGWRRITSCTILFLIGHGLQCGMGSVGGGSGVATCSGYKKWCQKELKDVVWKTAEGGNNADLNTFLRGD